LIRTRSRIIAHNDKIKQSTNNEVEHRDQGLTRPKVLILVPYKKCALKLVHYITSLIMRKGEEVVSNKKRFNDAFGPSGDDEIDPKKTKKDEEEEEKDDDHQLEEEMKKANRSEDFNLLFAGNTDDHFKIGLSVSKKSLKLYTEFYSSDIIIASPLGLKSVIGIKGFLFIFYF
jgi:U3 small nucleolar RNA-associated protein 25